VSKEAVEYLIKRGWELFNEPAAGLVEFTGDLEADKLLNDLENHPHAYVLACIMDRQMKAERAWLIPYKLAQKLGGFEFSTLTRLRFEDVFKLMTEPAPLHRFSKIMSQYFCDAVALISNKYNGNASLIWTDKPGSGQLVSRFRELNGAGPKIASMAANILVRHFKIRLSEYVNIDVSPDVHVNRVLFRLGLVLENAPEDQVRLAARGVYPEFPGILDFHCWEIGRKWCRPERPNCGECMIGNYCKYMDKAR
jgi:endonuclease-3